jgi:hypothetical protein
VSLVREGKDMEGMMGDGVRMGKVPSPLVGSMGVEAVEGKAAGAVDIGMAVAEGGGLEEVEEGREAVRTRVKFTNKVKKVRKNETRQLFRVTEEAAEPRQKLNVRREGKCGITKDQKGMLTWQDRNGMGRSAMEEGRVMDGLTGRRSEGERETWREEQMMA